MATRKLFETVENLLVFPSTEPTIEVIPTDGYEGAHRYRVKLSLGFKDGKALYSDKTDTIQFAHKVDKDTFIPGWQDEQLLLIMLDRAEKLNAKYPSEFNNKKVEGLKMALEACKERIEDRMNRGVMGDLKK